MKDFSLKRLNELAGLPEKVKVSEEEIRFVKPVKLNFRVNMFGKILEYEVEFDRLSVVCYEKPNYGDDKIYTDRSAEYVFKTNKGILKEVVNKGEK